jgi:hypothetical protein
LLEDQWHLFEHSTLEAFCILHSVSVIPRRILESNQQRNHQHAAEDHEADDQPAPLHLRPFGCEVAVCDRCSRIACFTPTQERVFSGMAGAF